MNTNDQIEQIFGAPISAYTRADAISDGMLVDVTEAAAHWGYQIPVAMTHAA